MGIGPHATLGTGEEVNGKLFSLHLMVGLKSLGSVELAVRKKKLDTKWVGQGLMKLCVMVDFYMSTWLCSKTQLGNPT